MRLSAAVPCYNGMAYLGRALQALLDQTRPAHEIIVVDDGSSDGSADCARGYPVRLIQHAANQGLAAARNTALEAASGEVLVFVDVDALAAPNLLAVLAQGYEHPTPRLAGVGGQGIEANIVTRADRWRRAHASQGHGPAARDVPYLFGLCMSYDTAVLREAGGFNTHYRTNAEDMELGLRLTRLGYRLRYLPGARVYHQRSDDAASLKRAMSAWYAAAWRARAANQAGPWRLVAGTLRRLITDPLKDFLVWRDPSLALLTLEMTVVKLRALLRAAAGGRAAST